MADFSQALNQALKENALLNILLGAGGLIYTAFIWPKKWYLLGSIGQPIAYAANIAVLGAGLYGMFLNSQAHYARSNYANTINPYYRV